MNSIIMGGQWGDEGKGKIVDLISKESNVVARYQGGANAGHTVYKNDKKIVLHQIPTGILRKDCTCILGNGMVVDPEGVVDEINILSKQLQIKNQQLAKIQKKLSARDINLQNIVSNGKISFKKLISDQKIDNKFEFSKFQTEDILFSKNNMHYIFSLINMEIL